MGYRQLLTLLLLWLPLQLRAEPVHLTTLEWPPYTSQHLPDGGLTGHIVKRAFAEAGLEVQFDFYPWHRAMLLASDPAQHYSGYFPKYFADDLDKRWHISTSVGSSVLGMAQQAGPPIHWQRLEDLASYRIGVVAGYINTREFDALMASKRLNTFAVDDDHLNLRKLQRDRLDLAVIDRDVFYWLTYYDDKLHPEQLQFNQKILGYKSLHIMFRPDQQQLQQRVNNALARLDIKQLSEQYKRRYLLSAPAPR
ncbi:substrate-binding periplasmic protein [Aeromonas veronii]